MKLPFHLSPGAIAGILLAGYILGKLITLFVCYRAGRWLYDRRKRLRSGEIATQTSFTGNANEVTVPLLADVGSFGSHEASRHGLASQQSDKKGASQNSPEEV